MAEPIQNQTIETESRWTPLWRWFWKCMVLLWSLFIFGIIDSIIATSLTSDKDIPLVSPVGRAMHNLPLTLSIACSLLLLTALTWILSRQRPSQWVPLPSEQDRLALVRMLQQEYARQLNYSLQGAAMMELHFHERTDITLSTAQLVFRRAVEGGELSLPEGTSIVEAYDQAGNGLLILGEPGAGKTTLLLTLAQELLIRAEGNSAHPIPVIVNLSSWAIKQPPLASWLIQQLQLAYRIPTRLSKAWLEHGQLLFLLDGLDEVEASIRSACIEAINTYHGEHFTPLVVCSRKHEYLTQEARLALPTAVVVQPLQEEQVMDYLKRIGKPMASVRAVFRTTPTFQHSITTPLLLNVVILTYRDKAIKDLPSLGSAEQQQHQIFDRYVERMLAQPVSKGAFKPQQIEYWLTWMAHMMKQQHLSEFYLEHLQSNWPLSKRSQMRYSLLFGVVGGLVVAMVLGLVGGLTSGLVLRLVLALTGGLIFGLDFVLFFNSSWRNSKTQLTDVLNWSWKNFWRYLTLVGLSTGLLIGLLFGIFIEPNKKLFSHVGISLDSRLGVGLFSGLLMGLLTGLLTGLLFGFSKSQIIEHLRIKPNQGIRSSGRNGLFVSFISIILLWLVSGLALGLTLGLPGGLYLGLILALPVGLSSGLLYGGSVYLRHYHLRYLLWRSGAMPWHYVRFLEEASERILLLKVGGGYRFIHPLFLDYFASQPLAIPPDQSPQRPSQDSF